MKRFVKRLLSFLLATFVVFSSLLLTPPVSAADTSYVQELVTKGFPKIYAEKLAKVHEKHPAWVFEPMKVDLDWDTVVKAESQPKVSTVFVSSSSSATRLFADRSLGTYTASNGLDYTYVVRDVGTGGYYVDASDICVATFLNPLNFIDDDAAILMFEHLGWGDLVYEDAVKEVEAMLSGSFMSKTRNEYNERFVSDDGTIIYVDTDGRNAGTSVTYAEAITKAAQEHGVNPYFLTSRIIGEMGYAGASGSVSGTVNGYTGYYNYMNVGAADSATGDAVKNGLATAKKRGWDSPVKAIDGGAEFIGGDYIKNGQDTQYLQKFNVVGNKVTTYHQYMTAVNGAHFMISTTYKNYEKTGILENKRVFKIPVYNNMPDGTGKRIYADGVTMSATVADQATIRKQPTRSATVSSLPKTVTIKAGIRDAGSMSTTSSALYCAMWYEAIGSGGVTAYVVEDYVEPAAVLNVAKGKTVPFQTRQDEGSTEVPRFFSWDTRIATVNSSGIITGVANGTTKVVAYLANGSFAAINVKVAEETSGKVPATLTSDTVSFNETASFVSKVALGTTAEALKISIKEKEYVAVLKDGSVITGETQVSTGCVVSIMDGSKAVRSYTVIVTGDVNGDGKVTAADSLGIRDHILGVKPLEAIRYKAADINADGKITAADSLGVRDQLIGAKTIQPKSY